MRCQQCQTSQSSSYLQLHFLPGWNPVNRFSPLRHSLPHQAVLFLTPRLLLDDNIITGFMIVFFLFFPRSLSCALECASFLASHALLAPSARHIASDHWSRLLSLLSTIAKLRARMREFSRQSRAPCSFGKTYSIRPLVYLRGES